MHAVASIGATAPLLWLGLAMMGGVVKAEFLLSVLDGLHKGASVHVGGHLSQIGSGSGCDVLLSDPGIADLHLVIRVDGRSTMVEAVGGPVTLNSRDRIEVGKRSRLSLPAQIEIAGVRLAIAREGGGEGDRRNLRLAWVSAAVVFVMGSVIAVHVNGAAGESDRRAAEVQSAVLSESSRSTPGADVVEILRERLRGAGLVGLAVTADGQRLTVRGNLPASRMSEWSDVQKWFDGRFGASQVLVSHVQSGLERVEPRFNFEAVWFGDRPYVVGSDGVRLYVGAALEGGWVIKEIKGDHLTVRRGNEDFVLTF